MSENNNLIILVNFLEIYNMEGEILVEEKITNES